MFTGAGKMIVDSLKEEVSPPNIECETLKE